MNNNKCSIIKCALIVHIFSTNSAFCGSDDLKAKNFVSIFNRRSSEKIYSRRSENIEPGSDLQEFRDVPLTLPEDTPLKMQSHMVPGTVVPDPQDSRRVTLDLNSPRGVLAHRETKQRGIYCLSFFCIGK